MAKHVLSEHLGPPDLKLAGFQLWVHERQFPESFDDADGNWLDVTAHCGAPGADAWVQGSILEVTDIVSFERDCRRLLDSETARASLEPLEPNLCLSIDSTDRLGHYRFRVQITPEYVSQKHVMDFEIDQSFLPEVIRQCRRIAEEYPVRGREMGDAS